MSTKIIYWVFACILISGCGGGGGGGSDSAPPPDENLDSTPTRPGTGDPGPDQGESGPSQPEQPPEPTVPGNPASPAPEPEPEPEAPVPVEPEDPVVNPDPYASLGCGAVMPAETKYRVSTSSGDRVYDLDLPLEYDINRPYPIVFAFHGRGREGEFQSSSYGNLASTMGEDAILVYPEGIEMENQGAIGDKQGGSGTSWEIQGSGDLAFFDAMFEKLKLETCVDTERVYAVGFSMGGYFAERLACERGRDIRAFAAAGAGAPLTDWASCEERSAAWLAHDPQDPLIDYVDAGLASRDYWLQANACGPEKRTLSSGNCVEYTNCASGYPVRWCEYSQGNHHEWPNFAPVEVWSYFQSLD